jgi:hypothetical protein
MVVEKVVASKAVLNTSEPGSDVDPDIDMDIEHPRLNASRVTWVFHPKLNGMLNFF